MPVGQKNVLTYVRMEEGRAVQIDLEPAGSQERVGNIYVGKVEKLMPQIGAAFVRITKQSTCFLPLAKAGNCISRLSRPKGELKEQDEILVQVEKEAIRGKLPSLKTALEFSGKYLVLLTDSKGIFWSPRLSVKEKKHTGALLEKWNSEKELSFGALVRTNAGSASEEELKEEFERLYEQAARILKYGIMRAAGTCLYQSETFWEEFLKGLPDKEGFRIITDEEDVLESLKARGFQKETAADGKELLWYSECLQPLYKKYGLEELLAGALDKKVELPSGGFLVIEQTEAFAAIDVNSGRQKGKENAEDFYFRINREAAAEIARQIRLRNLSGTILIDFINMKDSGRLQQLFSELQRRFQEDPVRTKAIDITALNIMEVTRQKVRQPLWEQMELAGQGE